MSNTPRYWLAPHVVACSTLGGAVLLDLARSFYHGLDDRSADLLHEVLHEWTPSLARRDAAANSASAHRLAELLVQKGLITTSPARATKILQRYAVRAGSTTIDEPAHNHRARLSHVYQLVRAHCWAQHALRTKSLLEIALSLSADKYVAQLHTSCASFEKAVILMYVFRKTRPLVFSAHEKCLLHALTLTRFLSAFDVHATWMIGVRLCPWAAHSWVQLESTLLDATPEEVAQYTPILSV